MICSCGVTLHVCTVWASGAVRAIGYAPRVQRKTLAIDIAGEEPPREFRIFRAGVNESHKGSIVFDAAAAAAVMAAWQRWGVDVMIDLEHLAIDPDAKRTRTDATDARGWAKLALRNGELWAVDVQWTPDGEARLREKRQRYASPVVIVDKNDRAVEIVNVALVAMPATFDAAPLVAASRLGPDGRGVYSSPRLAALSRAATLVKRQREKTRATTR